MTGPHVRLQVAVEEYAVPVEHVREVAVLPVAALAGVDPQVRGVCNLRGEILPVFDLARLLGIGRGAVGAADHVLVVEHAGRRAGLLVDAVTDVVELPGTTEAQLPFVDSTAVLDGRLVGELSIPRTFVAMEQVAARG